MSKQAGQLNDFQNKLAARVRSSLGAYGKDFINEEIGGETGIYIKGEIRATNILIWIYEDSAEFTDLRQLDNRYEAVDFDTLDQLIDEYIDDLMAELARA